MAPKQQKKWTKRKECERDKQKQTKTEEGKKANMTEMKSWKIVIKYRASQQQWMSAFLCVLKYI